MSETSKNPNTIKNGGEGTFVGKVLRGIVGVSPDILNILGTVTGVDGLNKLGDAIRGNSNIPQSDKDLLLAEIDKDIEVAKEISKRYPNIKILLTTGYAQETHNEDISNFEILRKPFTKNQLAKKLKEISS